MIHLGDNIEVLRGLAANSIDACVTDAPYGLRFMGKRWDYEVPKKELWIEVARVLKPGAHLLSFFGTRTYHRGAIAIEDAGFEIRDQIGWLYGQGFPKGAVLKPAWEPICMARKPFRGTAAANRKKWGTGEINVEACRIGFGEDKARGGNSGQRKANGMHGGGIAISSATDFSKGRWPANVIHDGSKEVQEVFDLFGTKPGAFCANSSKSTPGMFTPGNKDRGERGYADTGSAARFFYCAKASRTEREAGLNGFEEKAPPGFDSANGGFNDRRWIDRKDGKGRVAVNARRRPRRNNHPTVKPIALMQYLCRLATPAGGTILDPFLGSGTTGIAARLEGFEFVGIEIDPEYFKIAGARIAA